MTKFYAATLLSLLAAVACTKADLKPIAGAGGSGGGAGGASGASGASGGVGGGADEEQCLADPVLSCNFIAGLNDVCNPVCQSDQIGQCKWCTEKCTLDGNGIAACARKGAVPSISSGQGLEAAKCKITNIGQQSEFDDCAPTEKCLYPVNGDRTQSYCFSLCGSRLDCLSNVACTQRQIASGITPSIGFCDPPYTSCNPNTTSPCCDPIHPDKIPCPTNQYCYLIAPDGVDSRTVCEFATGGLAVGQGPCSSSRDCLVGTVCVNSTCMQVCDLANPSCRSGTCQKYGAQYGYCAP